MAVQTGHRQLISRTGSTRCSKQEVWRRPPFSAAQRDIGLALGPSAIRTQFRSPSQARWRPRFTCRLQGRLRSSLPHSLRHGDRRSFSAGGLDHCRARCGPLHHGLASDSGRRWQARSGRPCSAEEAGWIYGRSSYWFHARRGFGQRQHGSPSWCGRAFNSFAASWYGDRKWSFDPPLDLSCRSL